MSSGLFANLPVSRGELTITRSAELSDCGTYRWTLGRSWRPGPSALWLGHNPSNADAERDDPTVLRWIHFTDAWDLGNFTAANLYPLRSSAPQACHRWLTRAGESHGHREVLARNFDVIRREAARAEMVIACWGELARDPAWVDAICAAVFEARPPDRRQIHCIGMTLSGAPKHPMARGVHRVPDSQRPLIWRTA